MDVDSITQTNTNTGPRYVGARTRAHAQKHKFVMLGYALRVAANLEEAGCADLHAGSRRHHETNNKAIPLAAL